MESILIIEVKYVKDYKLFLKFNTGKTIEVDICEISNSGVVTEP